MIGNSSVNKTTVTEICAMIGTLHGELGSERDDEWPKKNEIVFRTI